MKYIRDLDEMLASPPYYLGTNNRDFSLQSHHFLLDADRQTLQKVVNKQLNAPFHGGVAPTEVGPTEIPYGQAQKRTAGSLGNIEKIRYVVPATITYVTLAMIRYWRSQPVYPLHPTDHGWMAYTEALLQFPVRRDIEGLDGNSEALRFVAVVYIDDPGFLRPDTDPHTVPISLGREAFGMPKCPGEIFYCPGQRDPGKPLVQVWDNPPNQAIARADAIVFDPDNPADPDEDFECLPPQPEPPASKDDPLRYKYLAAELDLPVEDMVIGRRLGNINDRTSPIPPNLRDRARTLTLRDDEQIVIWNDLFLHMKLVGLKQFPDPTTGVLPDGSGTELQACYQAVVESPIEENPLHPLPIWKTIFTDQEVEFPLVQRVDLLAVLGLQHQSRRIQIPASLGFYMQGSTIYANPFRTEVWVPA